MKVLITGGSGFIGRHLTEALLTHGCEVHAIDNFQRKHPDIRIQHPNFKILKGDLIETDFASKLDSDYEVIYHFAAIVGVENVINEGFSTLNHNIRMTSNIIEFALELSALKRFIFTSTSEVYAGTLQNYGIRFPTPEDTPLSLPSLSMPRTSYMLSKIVGEAFCHLSDLPYVIFRPHNIYGPNMGTSHVIPQLLQKAFHLNIGDHLEVYSPEHHRTFCFIDDAVGILEKTLKTEACVGKTFNLGNDAPEIKMKDLGVKILASFHKDNQIVLLPPTEGSPERRCPDITMLKDIFNYVPSYSLDKGLQATSDWYVKNVFSKPQA